MQRAPNEREAIRRAPFAERTLLVPKFPVLCIAAEGLPVPNPAGSVPGRSSRPAGVTPCGSLNPCQTRGDGGREGESNASLTYSKQRCAPSRLRGVRGAAPECAKLRRPPKIGRARVASIFAAAPDVAFAWRRIARTPP